MSTGRPPIRPYSGNTTPVVSGLGADERKVDETKGDDELFCKVCSDQDAIFGVEDGAEEELKVSNEWEQAVRIALLPTPFQPTLSQLLDHRVRYPVGIVEPSCGVLRLAWKCDLDENPLLRQGFTSSFKTETEVL